MISSAKSSFEDQNEEESDELVECEWFVQDDENDESVGDDDDDDFYVKNPWGRSGNLLSKGLEVFQEAVNGRQEKSGLPYILQCCG